jgi:hypothetical protein
MYADYCPVARNNETQELYYIGKCNKLGNGNYKQINSLNNIYYNNSQKEKETGETYSENSFCYQSSLTKDNSIVNRAICYESFCSTKSLTIKIHDNYIVCPRQG